MNRRKICVVLTAMTVLAGAVLAPADARRRDEAKQAPAGAQISLDEAVARIRAQTGGRVLSAGATEQDGQPVYRIKVLLPSGDVRVFHVPAGKR